MIKQNYKLGVCILERINRDIYKKWNWFSNHSIKLSTPHDILSQNLLYTVVQTTA